MSIHQNDKLLTSSEIMPRDPEHCRRILEPWVLNSISATSLSWKWKRISEKFHWRGKIIKRSIGATFSKRIKDVASYRTTEHVTQTYGRTWESANWPHPQQPRLKKNIALAQWRDEGLTFVKEGLNQMQLERIMHVIALTRPARVLEVGAGMGRNLLPLAACFPDVEFTGLELTQAGVDRVKAAQKENKLPDAISSYCPFEIKDKSAHRKIRFLQGDATDMPFENNSFDLVFSHAAIEQMELVRDKALAEIVRVSGHSVLMVEPFADFNRSELHRLAIQAKNYFSLSVDELGRYGLEPTAIFSDWPQKMGEGLGLVFSVLSKQPLSSNSD